jgi:diguanylate cyclase (GGDEF)-like protein
MSPDHFKFPNTSAPPRARRLSLRWRLILIALLAVVPLMADRVRILEATRSEQIDLAYAQAVDLAKRGADAQIEVINSTKALLQVVARAYIALTATHQDCTNFLKGFAADVPWIKGFSVVGPNDRIVCSTRPAAAGLNMSDRDYIHAARESRGFVLSDYIMSHSYDQPAVIAAYSMLGKDEHVDSIILAPLDLNWVGHLADAIAQRAGASIFLIDSKGTVLTGIFNRDNIVGRNFGDNPLIQEALSQTDGTTTKAGLDGIRRIFAFMRMPGTEAHVVVGFEEREVLGRIDREIGIAYAELFLFGLFTLLATWIGGEKLVVEPIKALARTAARIGRGEHEVRGKPDNWAAEFVPLAAALEDMASQLATREQEMQTTNSNLEKLASIDGLSGLANRRSFDARLDAEWQRARSYGLTIGLMMIDVDHFKLYNDHYGHLEGDNCLKQIGSILTSGIRGDKDFIARYGGEEFVVLLPEASSDRVFDVAERLRATVAAQRIAHQQAPSGYITISIGVVSFPPAEGQSAKSLIESADEALYEAKRSGRNIVVSALADQCSAVS